MFNVEIISYIMVVNFISNRIGGIMVSVLASSAVDRGFEPRMGQTKDYKIGIVASPLSMQHLGERAKTGWL